VALMASSNIPDSVVVGDSAQWDDGEETVNGVAAQSSVWTQVYYLRGPSTLNLTSTVNGTGWRTNLTTAQSAALISGRYQWSRVISKAGERVTLATGSLIMLVDVSSQAAGYDGRSLAVKSLELAQATYYAFLQDKINVMEYEIAGRRWRFSSAEDMITHIDFLKREVAAEKQAEALAQGLGSRNNIYLRFTNVV
jgi:hypothetical protein